MATWLNQHLHTDGGSLAGRKVFRVEVALDPPNRICRLGKTVPWSGHAVPRFSECCEAPDLDVCGGALGSERPRKMTLGPKNEVK